MLSPAYVRVLIVDDQLSIRLLIRSNLQKLGFQNIDEAEDGEDGLRKLVAKQSHLVLADYNMPKLDGLGLLRAVRAHPPTSKIAYIMLTGSSDQDLVQRAVKFGVNNYLVKPFTAETLKQKIEAVLGPLL